MKKTKISNKSENFVIGKKKNDHLLIIQTIKYFQNLIQKTLLSIQYYKQFDIIGANELNLATQHLEKLFIELSNNLILIQNNNPSDKIYKNIEKIRNDLYEIFRLYGTQNLKDLINVSFGDEYLKNVKWDNNKFELLEQYFHPVSFKNMPWKKDRTTALSKNIQKNKIVEDFVIVEKSNNLDCFDLARNSEVFQSKVYGIKIAIHNEKEKRTLIISGLIDDILTTCISNIFIDDRLKDFIKLNNNEIEEEKKIFDRYLESLTLKEIIVYNGEELLHKYLGYINQINLTKQKTISQVVKEFISNDLYGQRKTLIQLLLKSDEHEYQYLAYLLYDLLSNDNNGNIDTSEQTLLFDSLPWKTKNFFKDAMKQTINYTNNLSNFDSNKIPLEQQICLMKVNDLVKEKAMNKLKEVKAKSDDNGSKARNYLEGLLKIPFGIYKKEPILCEMEQIKEIFKNTTDKIKKIDPSYNLDNIDNLTNIEIKNNCSKINSKFIINSSENLIDSLIERYTPDKRNDLIINICNINNLIKKNSIKQSKLVHSGKKIIFMKQEITNFINKYKDNKTIIDALFLNKNNSNFSLIQSINENINQIELKWKNINHYMKNVRNILDKSVHGHIKAKNQIERIIAQWINGEQSGYCFGFEGPPGIGKTSFAKKGLANCLTDENGNSRPFSFIAIGGQDNGSSLNGHNYTYVGSEWRKFVDILIKNKCMNPIIFIDELDKVSKTEHGREIIGILTHLVDTTQNDVFQDKYFSGIDIDLSKALFIFSYNDVSAIDRILLDRIHRIKFEHLTLEDKIVITNTHLLPEIYKNMGLQNVIDLTEENIKFIIENYTNEPGIRKYKELLFEIIGEINLSCLQNFNYDDIPIKITNDEIKNKYLKEYHAINPKKIPLQSNYGVINGLWANGMGQGGIIPIEVKYFPSGNFLDLKLTGLQGDVMKESMTVAKTLACNLVSREKMIENVKKCEETKIQGLHIHCPEGAVPKDGPSAGTAITSAIYSLLANKKIKKTVAITGEINLQGCVTAIGGLDLKILGGIKGGVKQFIFPKENDKDFKLFMEKYENNDILNPEITFHSVEHITEVFKLIFEEE